MYVEKKEKPKQQKNKYCVSWHSISGVQSIKDIAQFSNGNENGIPLIN